jgi:nanoRNase/pAp phosphatase (c-di-AMP/oligoRNAs hydrolase)
MAGNGSNGRRMKKRSTALLRVLAGANRVAVVTHDNPDPDAISSCMGLRRLISVKLGIPTDVVCRMPPQAGENRVAADISGFGAIAVLDPDWTAYDRFVLIDTQPGSGFNCLPPEIIPDGAVDHHGIHGRLKGIKYRDIRKSFGATASIITSYLMEQEVPIPSTLGAALLFGIEVDTTGLAGEQSYEDDKALSFLHLIADKSELVKMRFARLPQEYFEAFLLGIQGAFIYEDCILAYLGDLRSPEMTAIVAEFLLRFEGIAWVMCMGSYGEGKTMYLSLRTTTGKDASRLMGKLVDKIGSGGGHRTKAGGRVAMGEPPLGGPRDVYEIVRRRLLRALKINVARGRRIVQKKDILAGLEWTS